MAQSPPSAFAKVVDRFMAARKLLPGATHPLEWQRTHPDGPIRRTVLAIEIDGEIPGPYLQAVCHTTSDVPKFAISVALPPVVYQLHFDERGGHTNQRTANRSGLPRRITGHHVHTWAANRQFAKSARKIFPMYVAAPLPIDIVDFDSAMKWVCANTNIEVPHGIVFVLPAAEGLI